MQSVNAALLRALKSKTIIKTFETCHVHRQYQNTNEASLQSNKNRSQQLRTLKYLVLFFAFAS